MKKRILAVVALCALGVTGALAQASAIAERQALLKEMAGAVKPVGLVLRGEAPADVALAQKALDTIIQNGASVKGKFPADSQTGKTEALPVIWQNKAKFDALFDKLVADAKAAKLAIKDEASLKAEMPKVLANCGACHNEFRAK